MERFYIEHETAYDGTPGGLWYDIDIIDSELGEYPNNRIATAKNKEAAEQIVYALNKLYEVAPQSY